VLPTNLTPIEILDAGIHSETFAYRMYDRLAKRVEVPQLQARLSQLKKDEKDHRKTLRAHRRAMFGSAAVSISEGDAATIFGAVDAARVNDKESLIQTLYAAVRFEEYSAYFYDRLRHKVPNREARIFLEVLSSEGKFHADILKQQIENLRPMHIRLDERGRTVEAV